MTNSFLDVMWRGVGGDSALAGKIRFNQPGELPSAFNVTDFASAAIATAGLAVYELSSLPRGHAIQVDRRLSSFWFLSSLRPQGWSVPAPWDPIAGDYETRDGWIRLHTNAPHHRAAAQRVLGSHDNKAAMAQAVGGWAKLDLETAIVEAGGCAAEMRSLVEWNDHPQGQAVATERLIESARTDRSVRSGWMPVPSRPLAGLKVLDLTRVLAGPVATRFLAGYGANVLRIDPPEWDEPAVIPEVVLGKRCARLDLTRASDRATFEALLAQADLLLHGYRSGALEGLGYDHARRQALAPGLIDVSLNAYGWSGPWRERRGFDSLVQMSGGIANAGMTWKQAAEPVPLPVQALDHATGYLMAATAIRAVTQRLIDGRGTRALLSLARTGKLLVDGGEQHSKLALAAEGRDDLATAIEQTSWGEARRLRTPLHIDDLPIHWSQPAALLGSAAAQWA